MKLYLGMFGLLVVVVAVAVWPKPEGRRQDEQLAVSGAVEKKPGAETPRGRRAVEDDIPASNDRMKVTTHCQAAGEPDEGGWYLAESTEGGYSVKLPNAFNDLTSTTMT